MRETDHRTEGERSDAIPKACAIPPELEDGKGEPVRSGTCYVIGAGDFGDGCPVPGPDDCVIAGDGGYQACLDRNIRIDLVVGDFDSLGYVPKFPENDLVRLHPVKDDTDMHAGVVLGWHRGYRRFVLYGGTGGRLSHTVANIQLLLQIATSGGKGSLIGNGSRIRVIRGIRGEKPARVNFPADQYPPREGAYLSVFAVGGPAYGVTERGFYYGLEEGTLQPEFPLGVSNHFIGKDGYIEVQDGNLLIIEEFSSKTKEE